MSTQLWTQVMQAVDRRIVEHLKRSGVERVATTGSSGTSTPIAVDDVTIGINAEGQLYVKHVPVMVTLTDSDGADIVDADGAFVIEEL